MNNNPSVRSNTKLQCGGIYFGYAYEFIIGINYYGL